MSIETTAAWHEAVKAQFRYQAYLKCTLRLTPPGLHENMIVSSNATDDHSDVSSLLSKATMPGPKKWATLESNRWKLDGTWDIMNSDTIVDDYWTKPLKGSVAKLYFTFNTIYSIPGIYFEWDVISKSWPTKIVIHGYNSAGLETYNLTVVDIASDTGFIDFPMESIKSVTVDIYSWSKSGWRARINEILFGVNVNYISTNNGRIKEASMVDAAEPLASKLPVHTMSVVLRNEDQELDPLLKKGNSKYLATRQLIQFQWGFSVTANEVQWLDPIDYYLDTFQIPSDSPDVTLDATSRLAFLTQDFIRDNYTGSARTFKNIAINILQNSGIIKEFPDEIPYRLADKLDNMITTAPMPKRAINILLQYIAGATCTWLRTNPVDGFVQLDDIDLSTPVHEIGMMQGSENPGVELQKPLKSIVIAVYKYSKNSESTEIASGDYYISGTQVLTVQYNVDTALDVVATVTGGTLLSAEYFSSSAVLKISAPTPGANVQITLTGNEVKGQATYITSFVDENVAQGDTIILENPFVTETAYVVQLTEWLKLWHQKRQIYKIDYLGYPELVAGDEIDLITVYGEQPATITRNQIDFNGGWNGSVEAL